MGNFNLQASNASLFTLFSFMELIETLQKKGALSEEEGADIYKKGFGKLSAASQTDMREVLKMVMPDIRF